MFNKQRIKYKLGNIFPFFSNLINATKYIYIFTSAIFFLFKHIKTIKDNFIGQIVRKL